ncbi:MAG: translation initiation factor IF-2, partial [Desulfovibrionaceae bacterium]
PAGQRPTGPRPGGNAAPRPSGPSFGAGAPAGGAPGTPGGPDARDAQSKKKRTKGRRTVDFQQGAGDFGRRTNDDEHPRLSRGKGRRKNGKDLRPQPNTTQPLKAAKRKLRVTEAIRVADMAHQMGLKSNEIIKVLFGLGIMATINQSLDIDTATLVAAEFEYEVEKAGFSEDDYLIPTEADTPAQMIQRPPVVTIMGHVDHGKTSLLDAIRKSNVTSGEAGGITQHIGAYHVKTKRGEIVFLDTPGHEAFTAMRARGAQVTDLVVLVVAADDGVMEQTREAINHSKAAGVPIMVAVNKMDKPGADPDRVLRELAELGLQAESWGGDTVTAHVSAKTRQGLDELLELIALQAEILELKANPHKAARGHIVEAKLDKGRGPVATVLIQEGTLHQGDTFVCGVFSGRVRSLFNDQGKKIKEAGPAIPVEVQGFDGVPEAGEEFICVNDEKLARRIAETRSIKQRERELAKESKVTLETFLARSPTDQEALTLNLVLKADVQGSLEAITENLLKQSTEKVRINVVHGGAGAISESDILLASASQAIIIGFNVRPTAKIKEVAERENVDIRFYDIIYKLADEIKSAMAGMLAPVQREVYLGQADVRETFSVPKVGIIAGCHVSDGKFSRSAGVRLLRDGIVIYTGKIISLKRFKDDVREVLKGYECGIGLDNYNDVKVNDVIEAFEMIEEAATL